MAACTYAFGPIAARPRRRAALPVFTRLSARPVLDRWLPPIRLLIGVVATLVLGELQMAFILFAVGHAFEAFDAWKSLVTLFTSCEEALLSHPDLFSEFARTVGPTNERALAPSSPARVRTLTWPVVGATVSVDAPRRLPAPAYAGPPGAVPGLAEPRQLCVGLNSGTRARPRSRPC